MRTSARVLSLALLTTAGLLATAPAHAQCGPRPVAAVDAGVGVGVGVGLRLPVRLFLGLALNVGTRPGPVAP